MYIPWLQRTAFLQVLIKGVRLAVLGKRSALYIHPQNSTVMTRQASPHLPANMPHSCSVTSISDSVLISLPFLGLCAETNKVPISDTRGWYSCNIDSSSLGTGMKEPFHFAWTAIYSWEVVTVFRHYQSRLDLNGDLEVKNSVIARFWKNPVSGSEHSGWMHSRELLYEL